MVSSRISVAIEERCRRLRFSGLQALYVNVEEYTQTSIKLFTEGKGHDRTYRSLSDQEQVQPH